MGKAMRFGVPEFHTRHTTSCLVKDTDMTWSRAEQVVDRVQNLLLDVREPVSPGAYRICLKTGSIRKADKGVIVPTRGWFCFDVWSMPQYWRDKVTAEHEMNMS